MQVNYELDSLSEHYEQKGDYDAAQHLLGHSVQLKIQIYGCNYSGYCADLYKLSLLRIALEDYRGAREFLMRALKASKVGLDKPATITKIREALASLSSSYCLG